VDYEIWEALQLIAVPKARIRILLFWDVFKEFPVSEWVLAHKVSRIYFTQIKERLRFCKNPNGILTFGRMPLVVTISQSLLATVAEIGLPASMLLLARKNLVSQVPGYFSWMELR
jgi:hypothetical protein